MLRTDGNPLTASSFSVVPQKCDAREVPRCFYKGEKPLLFFRHKNSTVKGQHVMIYARPASFPFFFQPYHLQHASWVSDLCDLGSLCCRTMAAFQLLFPLWASCVAAAAHPSRHIAPCQVVSTNPEVTGWMDFGKSCFYLFVWIGDIFYHQTIHNILITCGVELNISCFFINGLSCKHFRNSSCVYIAVKRFKVQPLYNTWMLLVLIFHL